MDLFGTKTPRNENFKSDFQTPRETCEYMVSLLGGGKNIKTVLDPTPGDGNLKTGLENKGYQVTAPEDYFLLSPGKYDAVVMNPPFSAKYANLTNAPAGSDKTGMRLGYLILKECMNRSSTIIALMPWFTISDSDVRLRYLKKFGLRSVTALPRRTFQYARIQTVVLHLEKGYKGDTLFKVF